MRNLIPNGLEPVVAALIIVLPVAANSSCDPFYQIASIPIHQLGAVAGKQYQGDGLSVVTSPTGVRLHCTFQRLAGEVTGEGLWLRSTMDGASSEVFRVVATHVGRNNPRVPDEAGLRLDWVLSTGRSSELHPSGIVFASDNAARLIRPGLTEEYSVSVDGVRQDFIIEQRPEGPGELHVELEVTGATAEPLVNGVRLKLIGSGRELAYHRLHVTDAQGRELTARFAVMDATRVAVILDDAAAVYPVRIDPTFSDADWVSFGGIPGVNNHVFAAATDDAGNLYVGGNFDIAGNVFANRIAKWDGNIWSPLGTAVNGSVQAIAVLGTNLYAGGDFTTAGGIPANFIAKWDGNSWTALGAGMNNTVKAMTFLGSSLIAGGAFTTAGESPANRIALWNGTAWSALGSGLDDTVQALAVSGVTLYVGGNFTTAGGSPAYRIAQRSGTGIWSGVGSGVSGGIYGTVVTALKVSGDGVFVAGDFTGAGGIPANNIARWNGNSWSALGTGLNGPVTALAVSGSQLFAGGLFTSAGGIPVNHIAHWNGSFWSALGTGVEGVAPNIYALAVSGTDVFAGGWFASAGESGAKHIARWNGDTWSPLGAGINHSVYALAISGTDLYVGGAFAAAGGIAANGIARWDGNAWSPLGSGMGGTQFPVVHALAVVGTNLYAGGDFASAGGIAANSIAQWNGQVWSPLGPGINGVVRSLAHSESNLYAGGEFTTAGEIPATNIASWSGNTWSALGPGLNSTVHALAVSASDLYAGGDFWEAEGKSGIAKWDGSVWSALGSGMDGSVYALVVSGNDLYAGGAFTMAGGNAAVLVAKWNGSIWSTLGEGIGEFPGEVDTVRALAISGRDLYAGGFFSIASGTPANSIAKWDGITWSALGSGMNSAIYALTVSGTDLYAGGEFTTAGAKVSAYIAKANIGAAGGRFADLVHSPTTGFRCTFRDASIGQPYRVQASSSLSADVWTDITNFTYTGPIIFTDVPAGSNMNRFFRAITP